MKRLHKYTSFMLLGLIIFSVYTSTAMAAAADYLPDDEDVEGYDLIWEYLYESPDPFEPEENMTAGAQIWAKNDTENNVIAVIGSVVVELSENPLMQDIPGWLKTILEGMPETEELMADVETWWDLLSVLVTEASEQVEDVTATIGTTTGSIAFNNSEDGYMIFSVDAGVLIWTFAFTISQDWFDMAAEAQDDLQDYFDDLLESFQALISAWASIVDALSGGPWSSGSMGLETAGGAPVGDETSESDVQNITQQIGSQYSDGIPGYSALIILGLLGGFSVYFIKRKKITVR